MVKLDNKGKVVISGAKVTLTKAKRTELMLLGNAIKFCEIYPEYNVQDISEILSTMSKDINLRKHRTRTIWTEEDKALLLRLHKEFGLSYLKYKKYFPNRTTDAIKRQICKLIYDM